MDNKKIDNLKMVCIGQLLSDSSGLGGGARFKNMISIFENLGIEINLIYYFQFVLNLIKTRKSYNSIKYRIIICSSSSMKNNHKLEL